MGKKTQTPKLVVGALPAQLPGRASLPTARPFPSWAHIEVGELPPETSHCLSSLNRVRVLFQALHFLALQALG